MSNEAFIHSLFVKKGAEKNGKSPDGTSFLDSTEKEEIKALLK